jgi:hypothetical protein
LIAEMEIWPYFVDSLILVHYAEIFCKIDGLCGLAWTDCKDVDGATRAGDRKRNWA